jgi:galactokinase
VIGRLNYEGSLRDRQSLATRLVEAGLAEVAAARKAALFDRVVEALETLDPAVRGARPAAFFVPGRIEVLGKHTDYAGGRSMVAATECGFCLAALPRDDRQVMVIDAARNETAQFSLEPNLKPTVGHWSNYPMTVARRIVRNFPEAQRGAAIALASDLPPAAGMSSSSALMVAVFLGLAEVNHLAGQPQFRENIRNLTDLAGYLGTVENGQTFGTLVGDRGVGTFGGSEDHTAMVCSRAGYLGQYAYCPVRFERSIRLPEDYTFAIAVSGVAAEKTGAAMQQYNDASQLASSLAEFWRRHTGRSDAHFAAILSNGPEALADIRQIVRSSCGASAQSERWIRRLDHFVAESEEILPGAGDALERGDVAEFGRLVARSQYAAEELLGNQIAETSYLACTARTCGAAAASAFGAGFGGSVWALVEKEQLPTFLDSWGESYRAKFPARAEGALFYQSGAGPATLQVS